MTAYRTGVYFDCLNIVNLIRCKKQLCEAFISRKFTNATREGFLRKNIVAV